MANNFRVRINGTNISYISQQQGVIGEKDFLSTIPSDCLHEIFSLLDLNALEIMIQTSRRMNSFAIYRMKRRMKLTSHELRIVQSKTHFAFHLGQVDGDLNYLYMLKKDGDDSQKETKITYRGTAHLEYESLLDPNKPLDPAHFQPLPSRFFNALNRLLRAHLCEKLVLANILFDNSLWTMWKPMTNSCTDQFTFYGVRMDPSCCERFSSYISRLGLHSVELYGKVDFAFCKIFNEQFIENCVNGNEFENDFLFDIEMDVETIDRCRFYATKSILQCLPCLFFIRLPSMVIDTQWLPELFERRMRMQRDEEQARWIIGITEPVTQAFNVPQDMEFRLGVGEPSVLKDRQEGNQISFSTRQTPKSIILTANYSRIGW